ncbi:glycosyltransferase family 4 protein [Nitrospirales bacterium NOB]|nr:glycosyltransferase family 4 protein [Nitrospirales bacterium NOB]
MNEAGQMSGESLVAAAAPVRKQSSIRRLVIIYPQFLDPERKRQTIGGVQTYLADLAELAVGRFDEVCLAQSSTSRFEKEWGNYIVCGFPEATPASIVHQVGRQYGENCRIVFGSENFACRIPGPSVCIQHGVYWDIPHDLLETGIKRRLPRAALALCRQWQAVRRLQAQENIVCVDLNIINWIRGSKVLDHLNLTYIPNYSSFESTKSQIEDKLAFRSKASRIRVLYPRRFSPIRGTRLLPEIWGALRARQSNIELVIAGEGPDEGFLRKAFQGADDVEFLISASPAAMKEQYEQADIVLVPSIASEGTTLVCLEAMASGCAIVATNVGGIGNLILPGYNGVLTFPRVGEVVGALDRMVADRSLIGNYALRGREVYEHAYSKNRWASQWLKVLESL